MAKTAKATAKSKAHQPKSKVPKSKAPKKTAAAVVAKPVAKTKVKSQPKAKPQALKAKVQPQVKAKPTAKSVTPRPASGAAKVLPKAEPKVVAAKAKPAGQKAIAKEAEPVLAVAKGAVVSQALEVTPATTKGPSSEDATVAVTSKKAKRVEKDPLQGLEKVTDPGEKWAALYDRTKSLNAEPYKMSGIYEAKTPIMHKVLGWGYVMSVLNDRMEVLFKDGIKFLISNYKG